MNLDFGFNSGIHYLVTLWDLYYNSYMYVYAGSKILETYLYYP